MAYKKYAVKQGDCISSIAFKYGFFPDTIWNDSKNSKLKQDRKDPNVLRPGDEVYIRDREEKEELCASDKKHQFKRKGVPEKLVIQFKIGGKPRANEAYVLDIDGELSDGVTDENGEVELFIPPNAKKGKISFQDLEDEYELDLGNLDPISEITGVQGRLLNLGFFCGPVDGKMSDELEQALRNFQESKNLEPTGELTDETRNKIQQEHGA